MLPTVIFAESWNEAEMAINGYSMQQPIPYDRHDDTRDNDTRLDGYFSPKINVHDGVRRRGPSTLGHEWRDFGSILKIARLAWVKQTGRSKRYGRDISFYRGAAGLI